jgi:uncharacterized protein YdaU (DUF1376 family)
MNYYERHLGDYSKDTAHLTMIEHGAYGLLLDRYYGTEAGIPADQVHRIARARTREEKQAVDVVLAEFFNLVEGVWMNKRAEEEIAKAHVKISAAKENGKKGGRPKKSKSGSENETQQKPSGLLVGSENETQQKAHQAPSTKHHTPESKQAASVDQPEAGTQPTAAADPIHGRAIELTTMLRKRGAALQASDPRLRRWAETGITDAQALAALETAQQRREEQGNHQPINAGYLDAILKDATGTGTPTKRRGNIHDERAATIAGLTGRDRKAEHGQVIDGSAIVVD